MSEYNPDYWQVISIENKNDTLYKIFASWHGGYVTGDSWRLNSGISKVVVNEKYIDFHGYSKSVYRVVNADHCYRTNAYSESILASLIERAAKNDVKIKILPFDTNWATLL